MSKDSVVFESVCKTFRRSSLAFWRKSAPPIQALKNVSFSVSGGEVLGLLGPNGSGKSTTLKLTATVLLPDSGRVTVNSFDTSTAGNQVRRSLGYALASERSFFPRLTVSENLQFFAALENIPRGEVLDRVASVLAGVNLSQSADEQAMKLSSGTYQRLAIARALLKSPSVLLLDEPTRSLDLVSTESLWELIRKMAASGMTIVLATHNFEEATAVCDRLALLHNGQLINRQPGAPSTPKQLRQFYLEMTAQKHEPSFLELPA